MVKIGRALIKEFSHIAEHLEDIAEKNGFDLSTDEDVERLNLITDGERLNRGVIKQGEIPKEWYSATFVEKVIATAFDYLHQINVTIDKAPDDNNDCDCCNSEATVIDYLCTLNHLCGFLQAYTLVEDDGLAEENFLSSLGSYAVSHRADQVLRPAWEDHCKKIISEGHSVSRLDDMLNIPGYDHEITKISPRTLKAWAREAGITLKAGRPKK